MDHHHHHQQQQQAADASAIAALNGNGNESSKAVFSSASQSPAELLRGGHRGESHGASASGAPAGAGVSAGVATSAAVTSVRPVAVAIPVPATELGQPWQQLVNTPAMATPVDAANSPFSQGQIIVNAVPTDSPNIASGCPTVSATPISVASQAGLNSERLRSLALGTMASFHESLITRGIGEFLAAADLLSLGQCSSFLYDLMSEEQLWHDICLVRFCGRKFRYRGSWKRTFLFQPVQSKTHQASSEVDDDNGPEISDSMTLPLPQVVPSMSAPRGIMSEYLQRQYFFRSLHLGHFVPESGPDPRFCCLHEAQWKALNAIDFSKRYTQQSLPVALKQLCVKWPAFSKWSVEQLARDYGDIQFKVSRRRVAADEARQANRLPLAGKFKMTMAAYSEYLGTTTDVNPLYIFDEDFGTRAPTLLKDFSVPQLRFFPEDLFSVLELPVGARYSLSEGARGKPCDTDAATPIGATIPACPTTPEVHRQQSSSAYHDGHRPDYQWLVVGPQKSGASWHTDPLGTSAWNALLRGRKRWAMYPPAQHPPGHDEDGPPMTSLEWYFSVYPTLPPQDRPLEFVQEPGDVIFIPSGWWHMVLNLEVTVSVTQNFVDCSNLDNVCRELEQEAEPELLTQFLDYLLTFNDGQYPVPATESESKLTVANGPDPAIATVNANSSVASRKQPLPTAAVLQASMVVASTNSISCYARRVRQRARRLSVPRWSGFRTCTEYLQSFADVLLWTDAVHAICKRHGLPVPRQNHLVSSNGLGVDARVESLRPPGLGVNPVFRVGGVVLKFFSHFCDDTPAPVVPDTSEVEGRAVEKQASGYSPRLAQDYRNCEVATLTGLRRQIKLQDRVPRILAHGVLRTPYESAGPERGSYRWPYVVMSYCSGQSLATITSTAWPGLQVNPSVLAHVACWVGETLRHFHAMDVNILAKAISPSFGATPCASLGAIKQAGHCHAACPPSQLSERPRELTQVGYMQFLRKLRASCVARHLRKWNIPDHLWLQMDAYLPPFDRIGVTGGDLVCGTSDFVLLHTDITRDNILMQATHAPPPQHSHDNASDRRRSRKMTPAMPVAPWLIQHGFTRCVANFPLDPGVLAE
eukprot:INCI5157.3.p1 GENE.INCI5157.3~~INCI5157.3.p1  ORF type:complete len:1120 (+),score=111.36 INCI5157.3:73-3360(+)